MKNGHLFHIVRTLYFDHWWFQIRKTNALINLIKEQDDIDKIYQYAKDLSEPKYEFLIKKWEDVVAKHFNDSNGFIDCSNTMDDVYEIIDDYNPSINEKP